MIYSTNVHRLISLNILISFLILTNLLLPSITPAVQARAISIDLHSEQGNRPTLTSENSATSPKHLFRASESVIRPSLVQTFITAIPATPTELQVGGFPGAKVRLSWIDNSTDETSFHIERSKNNRDNYTLLTTLPANTNVYTDTTVEPDITYWYRVQACNGDGCSPYSKDSYNVSFAAGTVPNLDERYMLFLVNESRADPAAYGYPSYTPCTPVVHNKLLNYAAHSHSQAILNSDFNIGHCFPDPPTSQPDTEYRCPSERARDVGYNGGVSENLIAGQDGWEAVEGAHQSFMGSEGHRNNILDCGAKEAGMGHAYAPGQGHTWPGQYTHTFCGWNPVPSVALPSGLVVPYWGRATTQFTFLVNFYDEGGATPTQAHVVIDDVPHVMTLRHGSASNGSYAYTTSLSKGTHTYYFDFQYGSGQSARLPASGVYNGPDVEVGEAVLAVPSEYATLAEALAFAKGDVIVQLATGTFNESTPLSVSSAGIWIQGAGMDQTIIQGDGEGHVLDVSVDALIRDLTITGGGLTDFFESGIWNTRGHVEVHSCRFTGNNVGLFTWCFEADCDAVITVTNSIFDHNTRAAVDANEHGIHHLINNTIVMNGQGISLNNSASSVENTIIVSNTNTGLAVGDSKSPTVQYNDVWGNGLNYSGIGAGTGSISVNPRFENASAGNYHLQTDSPCRDAGNPTSDYNDRDGSRNDMGAYGGPYAPAAISSQAWSPAEAHGPFTVSWQGYAVDGIQSYDIQYRVGEIGSWIDWLTHTTSTAAQFGPINPVSLIAGSTYYFRSRARDVWGNVEAWPSTADTQTTVVDVGTIYSISGQVTDDSAIPLPGVKVLINTGADTTTDANGAYTLTNLISGTYTLTPTKVGYTFSPITRAIHVPPNTTGQNFTGTTIMALGEPGLSFRYVDTLGEGSPYQVDAQHFNGPHSVAVDADSNLYVVESNGKRLLKFDSEENFLWAVGTAGVHGWGEYEFDNPHKVAVDSVRNRVYVADGYAHRVQVFDRDGNYIQTLGTTGAQGNDNAHFNEPKGVAVDMQGRVYVADTMNHRVQIFNSEGAYSTTLGTGYGTGDYEFNEPEGIALDSVGNIYVADYRNARVQIFTPDLVYLATLGVTGEVGSDNAHFESPNTVIIDSNDAIYVADVGNHRVQKFDKNRTYLATLGVSGESGNDNAHFYWPTGIAIDESNGMLYVADLANTRVQKFASDFSYLATLGVTGVPYRTDGQHYNHPRIAVDYADNLFILEENGYRLLKLNSAGVMQWSVGEAGVRGDDNEHFYCPGALDVDINGHVYVADSCNHRVQIFNADGAYVATLGTGYGSGNYEFNWPRGIAVDKSGYIYVGDTGNHRIQIYDQDRQFVARIGVTGQSGTDHDHFNRPYDVAVDASGHIYVADRGNYRVQKFAANRDWQLTLGTTGEKGDSFTHFDSPEGIDVDASGRVYIADMWNNRIQVFDTDGAYLTTIGGEWGIVPGKFKSAANTAMDSQNNLYVADVNNHCIQKFAIGVPDWQQVNINGFGEKDNIGGGNTLQVFKNHLYMGIGNANGSQIWRTADGTSWECTSRDGLGNPQNTGAKLGIVFNDYLYVGTWNQSTGSEIYRTKDGLSWTQVITGGFDDQNNVSIEKMTIFDNHLYAGTANDVSGIEIWRTSDGITWDQVDMDGFGDANNIYVRTMTTFNNMLYVGLQNHETGAEIWRSADGTTWEQTQTDGFSDAQNQWPSFAVYQGALYVGFANVSTDTQTSTGTQIWRTTNGSTWEQVVDDGFGDTSNGGSDVLVVFSGALYSGTYNRTSGTQIHRTMEGKNWSQVAPAGFGDSNNYSTYAGAIFNKRLFLATANEAHGAEVWQYASPAQPESCYAQLVGGSSTVTYTTLQDAVDAATEGDTIKVAGTCSTINYRENTPQIAYIDKTITIRGGYTFTNGFADPPDPAVYATVLNAQGQGRGIYIKGDVQPTIEGLQITGGWVTDTKGAGVFIVTATAVISNCQIYSNTVVGDFMSGGGMFLSSSASKLNSNTILNNTVAGDGGVGGGVSLHYSNATLTENTIMGNQAIHSLPTNPLGKKKQSNVADDVPKSPLGVPKFGGGIFISYSSATLIQNVITNNKAAWGGGLFASSSNNISLHGNRIISNTCSWTGGGLYLSRSSGTVSGNLIYSNRASYGSGMYLNSGTIALVNNIIDHNHANIAGSAVYVEGSFAHFLHNTIADNTSEDGSGIYIATMGTSEYSSVAMTNTILANHTVGISVTAGNTLTINGVLWHTTITPVHKSPEAAVSVQIQYTGDPAFVNAESHDYHILDSSTALDRGIATRVNVDIDEQARPHNGLPDLGADEWWPEHISDDFFIFLPLILRTLPTSGPVNSPPLYAEQSY